MEHFQQNDVKPAAADAARGPQGLDKDPEVARCGEIADFSCDQVPSFQFGSDFRERATITCDVASNFKYSDAFGDSTLIMDEACPARPTKFKRIQSFDDPNDGEIYCDMQ